MDEDDKNSKKGKENKKYFFEKLLADLSHINQIVFKQRYEKYHRKYPFFLSFVEIELN